MTDDQFERLAGETIEAFPMPLTYYAAGRKVLGYEGDDPKIDRGASKEFQRNCIGGLKTVLHTMDCDRKVMVPVFYYLVRTRAQMECVCEIKKRILGRTLLFGEENFELSVKAKPTTKS